jgi:hypothetical protein
MVVVLNREVLAAARPERQRERDQRHSASVS